MQEPKNNNNNKLNNKYLEVNKDHVSTQDQIKDVSLNIVH